MNTREAAVLALVDDEKKVLLCKRSLHLSRHPGEVCLPGGLRDDADRTLEETAKRETREEVGIAEDAYSLYGEVPPMQAKAGTWVHTRVARLNTPTTLVLNASEVESAEWIPLEDFLSADHHSHFMYGDYMVHTFQTGSLTVFGLTAYLVIFVAMRVLDRLPSFDLLPQLTVHSYVDVESTIKEFFRIYSLSRPYTFGRL